MGAGYNTKGTICSGAFVDVHADRHQLMQQINRRLYEDGAFLFGPAAKSMIVYAGSDRDAEILVCGDQPIAGWRLLEKSALGGDKAGRNKGGK